MKICCITSMHCWDDDRIFQRACVGLADLGNEVTLVAPAEKDFKENGVQIISIKIRNRIGKHILSPWDAFLKTRKIKADVYHFYNPNMMLIMMLWSFTGKKIFIDIHENYESRVAKTKINFINNILIFLYRKTENMLCSFFTGITVVTKSMEQKLKPSNKPILIVDNLPFLARLSSVKLHKDKSTDPTIITSGTHSVERNCIQAIEALPLIKKEIPNIKMKFVGSFSPAGYKDVLISKAKELNVEENLIIEGMLPWLENFTRISSAHIGCVFYNDNLNNRVTLPNRLYEYMYSGLAVLGEKFPEVENVVNKTNCGLTVNSKDPASIANAAIELFSDLTRLKEIQKNAQSAVQDYYNFDRAVRELLAFYEKS